VMSILAAGISVRLCRSGEGGRPLTELYDAKERCAYTFEFDLGGVGIANEQFREGTASLFSAIAQLLIITNTGAPGTVTR